MLCLAGLRVRVVVGGRARRLPDRSRRQAPAVGGGLRVTLRCLSETAVHRPSRPLDHHAAAKRHPKPRQRPASSRVGGVQPARHHLSRGAEGHRRAHLRVHRSRGRAPLGAGLLRDARARGGADRRRRPTRTSPASHVHVPPRRETKRSAAVSRARTSSATRWRTSTSSAATSPAPPTCGPSTKAPARDKGFDPAAVAAAAANADRLGAKVVEGGHRRPAWRRRHARPDPRVPPSLRGGWGRPGDLREPGGEEPPRAHHGEPRALRPRGAAGVQGTRRACRERQGSAGSRRSSSACSRAARGDHPPAAVTGTTRFRALPRAQGRPCRAPTRSISCSIRSPATRRSGDLSLIEQWRTGGKTPF